eukprot:COSAG05_NODE_324_length_11401_cov_6.009379_5_plen_78_part_00
MAYGGGVRDRAAEEGLERCFADAGVAEEDREREVGQRFDLRRPADHTRRCESRMCAVMGWFRVTPSQIEHRLVNPSR